MIQLQGFDIEVPNQVYLREEAVDPKRNYDVDSFYHVLVLGRYRLPTAEEIIKHIRRQALGVLEPKEGQHTPLQQAVAKFPEEKLKSLTTDDDFLYDTFSTNLPHFGLQDENPDRMQLKIVYGRLSQELLAKIRTGGNRASDYLITLDSPEDSFSSWREWYTVRLHLPNGYLPPLEIVTALVRAGTTRSRVFQISRNFYEEENILEYLGLIYDAVKPENVEDIPDQSPDVLENLAKLTVQRSVPVEMTINLSPEDLKKIAEAAKKAEQIPEADQSLGTVEPTSAEPPAT